MKGKWPTSQKLQITVACYINIEARIFPMMTHIKSVKHDNGPPQTLTNMHYHSYSSKNCSKEEKFRRERLHNMKHTQFLNRQISSAQ